MLFIFTKVVFTNDVIPYQRAYFVAVWHSCLDFSTIDFEFVFSPRTGVGTSPRTGVGTNR